MDSEFPEHKASMTHSPIHAFTIGENLPGMQSQIRGLAERAGWDFSFHAIAPSGLEKFLLAAGPKWCRDKCLHNCDGEDLRHSEAFEQADVIISVGGKGAYFGRELRSDHRPVIQIQNPRVSLSDFDLVIVCHHDSVKAQNVLTSRTALHDLSPHALWEARQGWQHHFKQLGRPLTVALIGGSNGRFRFSCKEAHHLAQSLISTKQTMGGSLIALTSRRTDPSAADLLAREIACVGGELWEPQHCDRHSYKGIVACADNIVVTEDSVSMISEAVATHAPVSVFALPGHSKRIGRFVEDMELAGRVKVLHEDEHLPDPRPVHPLDDTDAVVEAVHRRLGL